MPCVRRRSNTGIPIFRRWAPLQPFAAQGATSSRTRTWGGATKSTAMPCLYGALSPRRLMALTRAQDSRASRSMLLPARQAQIKSDAAPAPHPRASTAPRRARARSRRALNPYAQRRRPNAPHGPAVRLRQTTSPEPAREDPSAECRDVGGAIFQACHPWRRAPSAELQNTAAANPAHRPFH